jgi:hypothetical protein
MLMPHCSYVSILRIRFSMLSPTLSGDAECTATLPGVAVLPRIRLITAGESL